MFASLGGPHAVTETQPQVVCDLSVRMCERFSCVQHFATPWTIACQAPLSMKFSSQEYGSGLPCSPPGDLPDPGIEPAFPALQSDSLPSEPPGKP